MKAEEFGSFIRSIRKQKKLTIRYVEERCGVSNSYLSQLETGKRGMPSPRILEKLADGLGYPYEELMKEAGYLHRDNMPIDKPDKKSDNSTYNTTEAYRELVRGFGEDNVIPTGVVNVPVVAEISCGEPSFTEDSILGFVPMGTALLPGADISDYIFLRASGDSMIEADIKDGSFVLIRKQSVADNGDIVAVCIGNENATLKRIYFNGEHVVLAAENPRYMPMTHHGSEVRIVGKAVMVTKSL